MIQPMPDDSPASLAKQTAEERKRIIRQRNFVVALVLTGFVVLFFAITIVKMKI